ncbi:DNA-binding protein [Bradyrhizobium barranii]|uniref:DNA-binding protein n=1 Tax=Bradyrhizobium barranii TaxID=2992140 RepID=A0ABY3QAE3_9BRAD|nr:DNA-binding protein [Bradyrhizobium japonicum]UFW82849.1 DNA-binding protein [Bradyrhizobium japonicum]
MSNNSQDEIVWGAAAIAPIIGRTETSAFRALQSGRVPGARNVAGRWGLHVPTFLASFEPTATARHGVAA